MGSEMCIRDRGEAPDAAARRSIIAQSDKPSMTFVDVVGLDGDATDIGSIPDVTLTDIMMSAAKVPIPRTTIERAKRNMAEKGGGEGLDVGDHMREANREEKERIEEERREAARRRSLVQKGVRASIHTDAELHVEDASFGQDAGAVGVRRRPARGSISDKALALAVALGVNPDTAYGYSRKQAGTVISSMKKNGARADWGRVRAWERNGGGA